MKPLIYIMTMLLGCTVGFIIGEAFGMAGIFISIPVGFLIGMMGALIAGDVD